MSTDTLEPQAEDIAVADEGPSTLPLNESVEVGASDEELELAIADAEHEGMPVPRERTAAEKLHDAEIAQQIEEATVEVCERQERAERAWEVADDLKAQAKDAVKAAEVADEDLSDAARRLRKLRAGRFPDADKYPLLDRPADPNAEAKAGINEQFSKPEAIPPAPAEDIQEHFRRMKRDTPLDSIGLTPKVVEILAGAGFRMVIDLDKLEGRDLATIRSDAGSITEKRAEQVRDAIETAAAGWMAAWNDAHPGTDGDSVEETVADMDFEESGGDE
jgi:hypothetical protein